MKHAGSAIVGGVIVDVLNSVHLAVHTQIPAWRDMVFVMQLHKSRLVARGLGAGRFAVVYNWAGQLLESVVIVHFGRKLLMVVDIVEKVALDVGHTHGGVLTAFARTAVGLALGVIDSERVTA